MFIRHPGKCTYVHAWVGVTRSVLMSNLKWENKDSYSLQSKQEGGKSGQEEEGRSRRASLKLLGNCLEDRSRIRASEIMRSLSLLSPSLLLLLFSLSLPLSVPLSISEIVSYVNKQALSLCTHNLHFFCKKEKTLGAYTSTVINR